MLIRHRRTLQFWIFQGKNFCKSSTKMTSLAKHVLRIYLSSNLQSSFNLSLPPLWLNQYLDCRKNDHHSGKISPSLHWTNNLTFGAMVIFLAMRTNIGMCTHSNWNKVRSVRKLKMFLVTSFKVRTLFSFFITYVSQWDIKSLVLISIKYWVIEKES